MGRGRGQVGGDKREESKTNDGRRRQKRTGETERQLIIEEKKNIILPSAMCKLNTYDVQAEYVTQPYKSRWMRGAMHVPALRWGWVGGILKLMKS